MLGTGTVSSGFNPAYNYGHPYFAWYAQDEYHATPKLALTYGLRYSLELPDSEVKNQYIYLDLTSPSPLNAQVTSLGTLTGGAGFVGVNGKGSRIQTTQYKNFDPRIGFAYRWDEQTVVRAGFGIFHAPPADLANASIGFAAVTTSNPAQANGVTPLFNKHRGQPEDDGEHGISALPCDTGAKSCSHGRRSRIPEQYAASDRCKIRFFR